MKAQVPQDFSRERLAKHFVYESYDDDTQLFFNRGSTGFVLLGWPLVGTSLQAQGEIAEFLRNEENLPAGSSLQVLMIGSHHIDHFLSNWQNHRQGEIFCQLAKKRVQFLKNKAQEEGVVKDMVLLISVTIPAIQANIDDMVRKKESLQDTFKSIGLVTENVDAKQLLKFIRIIFAGRRRSTR